MILHCWILIIIFFSKEDGSNNIYTTNIKGDICDNKLLKSVFEEYTPNSIIHLAAESHVDNSIDNPNVFIQTNVMGMYYVTKEVLTY